MDPPINKLKQYETAVREEEGKKKKKKSEEDEEEEEVESDVIALVYVVGDSCRMKICTASLMMKKKKCLEHLKVFFSHSFSYHSSGQRYR